MGSIWESFWGHFEINNQCIFATRFWTIFVSISESFGVDVGAKMEPFGRSRVLEKRTCDFAKMLGLLEQNLCF